MLQESWLLLWFIFALLGTGFIGGASLLHTRQVISQEETVSTKLLSMRDFTMYAFPSDFF